MSRMSRKKRREEEEGGQTLCFEYSLIRSTDGMGCLCGWRVAHPGNYSGLATDAFTRSPPCLPHAATALPRGDNRLSPPGPTYGFPHVFVLLCAVSALCHRYRLLFLSASIEVFTCVTSRPVVSSGTYCSCRHVRRVRCMIDAVPR